MSNLKKVEVPKGWSIVKQGNISRFINGRAYKQTEFRESGTPIVRIQNLTGSLNYVYSDLQLPADKYVNEGDLIYAWSATFGPYIWKGTRAIYHYHIWKIECEESKVDKQFYYYRLGFISNETSNKKNGSVFAHLTKSFMESHEIILPPLNEQQKIASILSSVDKAIEKTEAIIERTEKVKKGLMQQLFTKGIGHTKFKKTEIGEIPEEWEVVKVIDIAENEKNAVKPGPFGSSLKKEFYVKAGYKVYGQEQVIANDFTIGDYYIDDKKYKELNAFKIKPFDLLISLVGTFGKIAVVPEREFKPGIINPRLLKITFDKSKANVHFYKYYMSSSSFYQQLEGMSQGGTMGVINGKILKSIHFPLPPLDEQQRIVDILTNIDQNLDIEKRKYEQLKILKKGLMQSLLTGKVRVKMNEAEVTKV